MGAALTLPEVAKAAGVEYRTLKSWADRGLLGRIDFEGAGRPPRIDHRQQALAIQLGYLRRAGLTLDALADVARQLREGSALCPLCNTPLPAPPHHGERR
jgi:DNA-binding transcriptional MerR regulator